MREESTVLKELSEHPNLIKTHEVLEDSNNMYLVMECMENCCELQKVADERLAQKRVPLFDEDEVATIVRMLSEACLHMHVRGIAHRDLKLENILVQQTKDGRVSNLKVIDFGFAKQVDAKASKTNKSRVIGTPLFIAPEVHKNEGKDSAYTTAVDMWALGVIAYYLFAGKFPFRGASDDLRDRICNSKVSFRSPAFNDVSDEAKEFIRRLLHKIPVCRLTADNALRHPFLNQIGEQSTMASMVSTLSEFNARR